MANQYLNSGVNVKEIELIDTVENASPHELTALLFTHAKIQIRSAKVKMENKMTAEKGQHISKAIGIISELKDTLNHEKGGKLAERLDAIYTYTNQLLLDANINNDQSKLDEAYERVNDIASAWEQIKPEDEA